MHYVLYQWSVRDDLRVDMSKQIVRIEARTFALFATGVAVTADDVMAAAFCVYATAHRNLNKWYAAKRIHICGWQRRYKMFVPAYKLGWGINATKPKPLTQHQKHLRYWSDVENRIDKSNYQKVRRTINKFG